MIAQLVVLFVVAGMAAIPAGGGLRRLRDAIPARRNTSGKENPP